ncbi:MAG: sensor histidine kinase [Aurantibacter sp.]
MKDKKTGLLRKASKASLLISLALMLASTVVLYLYAHFLLEEETEEGLRSTAIRIEEQLQSQEKVFFLPPLVEVRKVDRLQADILKDTTLIDPLENEEELFTELSTFKNVDGENLQITVRALALESEDILEAIVISYFLLSLAAFAILFYLNKLRNKKLWNPFFENLAQMKKFSLSSETPIKLVESDISEFSDLNKEITALTDKVRFDYKNLKQFTEDVSHEMQTPLAIIQAKIENFINGNSISEGQFEQLTSMQKDIQRLTQLNKKLTLLTKIDNRQFVNVEKVNITHLVMESVLNFKELTAAPIDCSTANEIEVNMDPHLAEVLCNNLISNAVKHNRDEKTIIVSTDDGILSISNQGDERLLRPDRIFTRFYRETTGPKSTGLGLAITKKICDLYDFQISYQFKGARHIFKVTFI